MNGHPTLARRTVVAELLRERGELLVVSGLGGTTGDLAAAGTGALYYLGSAQYVPRTYVHAGAW